MSPRIGRTPRSLTLICVTTLTILLALVPTSAPANPDPIPAGFDLFETDPAATHFDVQIPADFFAPGSDPFTGQIKFAGEPLETFNGAPVGDADTIVERKAPADPLPDATVPIEIVALNLVSMEPITVTFGGLYPQKWDVRAGLSPTRQSTGQIAIHKTDPAGGTFDSTLEVVPLLTFTDLGNGHTRVIDGAVIPSPQLTMTVTGAPWRTGCVLPALAVPGVNDGFCPGLTTLGDKQLTVFNAPILSHGVRPAQPALEHFKCYKVRKEPFQPRQVNLTDQFGTRLADISGRNELCNPVRKWAEPFRNKAAHLVCYTTQSADVAKAVVVRNQFGSQRLNVHTARRLCVPSEKRKLREPFQPIQVPIDHFQCYAVDPLTQLLRLGPIGQVKLRDQFGRESVKVGQPVQLCAPVQKDTTPSQHPVSHLVCYAIRDDPVEVRVQIQNQFEKKKLSTTRPVLLCVPSAKVVIP